MTVLWSERRFSGNAMLTAMVEAAPRLKVIGTPKMPLHGLAEQPPVAWPNFRTDPYAAEKMKALIGLHGVDVVWPLFSAQFDLSFLSPKTQLMAPASPTVIRLMNSKGGLYDHLRGDSALMEYATVTGADAAERAFEALSEKLREQGKHWVTIKPDNGVNGSGYFRFDAREGWKIIDDPDSRIISPETYFNNLRQKEELHGAQSFFMGEYLPGLETTFDALCDEGKVLKYVARTKEKDGTRVMSSRHPMLEHMRELCSKLELHGLVCVQYRQDVNGKWCLLEADGRGAGGVTHAEEWFRLLRDFALWLTGELDPSEITQPEGFVHAELVHTIRPIVVEGTW